MKRFVTVLAAALAVALTTVGLAVPAQAATLSVSQYEAKIVAEINSARSSAGLSKVEVSTTMGSVSRTWSKTMASKDSFKHNPSYASQIPGGWSSASENVVYGAVSSGQYTPAAIHDTLMNSSGHRANILDKDATHVGVGVAFVTRGGYNYVYVTENFADYPKGPVIFPDVQPSHTFYTAVTWLAEEGITSGYSDGDYKPTRDVTRGQMAAFLYRFAGSPSYAAPKKSPFPDVSTSHTFYKEIAWLSATGITSGYSDGDFKPSRSVTRGQMAAFLYRFAGSPSYRAPSKSEFPDVSTGHTFYRAISWLSDNGITYGYSDGDYKSGRGVTRGAMAAFLYRFDAKVGPAAY